MISVLWLCSWYPNKNYPYEGDFIQRHARALALYMPVTVVHVVQYGEHYESLTDQTDVCNQDNLREIIVYFRFKRTGISFLDKLRYNLTYFSVYRRFIRQHFKKEGIPDLVHLHIPMKAGIIAGWIKKKWKCPYIVSEQSSTYCPAAKDNFNSRSLYYRSTVKKIFQNADGISNVSYSVAEIIKRLCNVQNIRVIPNTADTAYFNYRPFQPKPFRFIHVSSLNEQKNVYGMLNAFKKLGDLRKDWELVLVGPITPELERYIASLNLKTAVSYTGEITYREVALQMQSSSAFVLFSKHENLPCVLVEAFCCGLPVIATKVGGVPDIVTDENGFLVESDNESQLLDALAGMMENYSLFDRKKISEEARSQFSYDVVGKRFYDFYLDIQKKQTQADPIL